MSRLINKIFLFYILTPIIVIGGLALVMYSSKSVTDPFIGMANVIWFALFFSFLLIMVLCSLLLLLLKNEKFQNNSVTEALIWFIIPLTPDFIIIYGRTLGRDFDIGNTSANLMLLLAFCNIIGLAIGFYIYRKEIKSI